MSSDNFEFKRSVATYTDGREFIFQYLEYVDKSIIQIYADGEIDSTIDIQLPSIVDSTVIDDEEEDLESKIKSSYVVGHSENFKTLILSTQVGKLLVKLNRNQKPVILNTSSKIFTRGNETNEEDFGVLLFVVESLKSLLS